MDRSGVPEVHSAYCRIHNMLFASYLPKILNGAVEIGVFEALAGGELSATSLATKIGTDTSMTKSLCEVLVAVSILEKEAGVYALSPASRDFLITESSVHQLSAVKEFSGGSGPFDNLVEALKGATPKYDRQMWNSQGAIESMAQGAKDGTLQSVVAFVTGLPEFFSCVKMCDMAGSGGYYSRALIACNQRLYARVYDQPEVVRIAFEMQKKKQEALSFHPVDIDKEGGFGQGYDLFFASHFLYEKGFDGSLAKYLVQVNRAMVDGGVFVSNHMSDDVSADYSLTIRLVELLTKCMGYPTHCLPRDALIAALEKAGFGNFTIKDPVYGPAYPCLLVAARKVRDV